MPLFSSFLDLVVPMHLSFGNLNNDVLVSGYLGMPA